MVKLFFELNGQPRTVRVPKQGAAISHATRHKAEPDNTNHVAAPMPGSVALIAVKTGQTVKKGSPLLSIEAMKMESMITAERDGCIGKIHVVIGDKIEAKDLLMEIH
jgi:pyruvate carboxylase